MAQKHLQLLRNNTAYTSYTEALNALTSWDFTVKPLSDGTPVIARYTETGNDGSLHQRTLLGVVNNGSMDIINNVADYLLRNYTAFTGDVTTITSADDVKTAIAKLEKHIQDVVADITVTVEEAKDANTQAHLDITATTSTTEGDTYTIGLKDVASESALTQEISDRESGDNALSNRLGDGVTAANTATAQLTALSGDSKSVSGDTSVEGAKRYADEKVRATLDGLDYTLAANANKVVVSLKQTDGKVSGTSVAVDTLTLDNYSTTADSKVASTDTIANAFEKLQGQINAMNLNVVSGAGEVITAVSEEDGKVSAEKTAIKDVTLTGYVKDTTKTGALAATDDIEDALSKIENNIEAAKQATTVASADNSINVTPSTGGTDINVNIKSGEHVLAKDGKAGLYTDLDLIKITKSLPTNVKERYQLLATDNTQIGQNIDIYKDNTLKSVSLDEQELVFTYIVDSGESVVRVDVSKFLTETEFGSGVTANGDGYVHGVVDQTSEEFLTVGADGFKLSGVQAAINSAIDALDVTDDTAVTGQYVAAIKEADGIVSVKTRANVSEAVLNNYAKGSDATAVVATDTVNAAISKLENQVDKAKAAATTKVAEGTDAGNNMKIVPTTSTTDGSVTYTINLTDVASASALTKEIGDRERVDGQSGSAYTAHTDKKYISGATTLDGADVALNDAIADLDAEAIKTITSTNTGCTVTVSGDGNTRNIAVNTDGSQVKLTGYETTGATGAPAATDSVNAAIAKLYNRTLATEVKAGSATTVSQAADGTTVDVKLDTESEIAEYNAAHAKAVNEKSKNVLEITKNGLYLNNNWDCGTY